jgi:hypothetical protein
MQHPIPNAVFLLSFLLISPAAGHDWSTGRSQRSFICQDPPPIPPWSKPACSPTDGPPWYGWRR